MVSPISTRKLCFEILKVRKEELLALVADADSYYNPYIQRKTKPDGTIKVRSIEPSSGYLKTVQRKIDRSILKPDMHDMTKSIKGGRKGVSVAENAREHAKSRAIMKYDVKNFFPSIEYDHVYNIFRYRLNFCEEATNILAKLCTYPSTRPHVPQGAPTSTSIAMYALEPMCNKLDVVAQKNNLAFTIWVDDITISGNAISLKKAQPEINHIVNSTPFTIHPDKDSGIVKKGAKVGKESGRKVTGVTIDNENHLTLGKRKHKSLKKRVARNKKENPSLRGSLLFLKQVSPNRGKKLYHKYVEKIRSRSS